MSERESGGFGAFLLGIAVGAVAGFLFAPEAGEDTRRKLSKRLKNLRDVAEEKADEVRTLLEAGEDEAGEPDAPDESEDAEAPRSTREELERRLQAARRRRRGPPGRTGAESGEVEEEDEPVA